MFVLLPIRPRMNSCVFLSMMFTFVASVDGHSFKGCTGKGNDWPNWANCKNSMGHVECSKLDSLEPLAILPHNLQKLTILDSTFKRLDVDLFESCHRMKKLHIQNCALESISPIAFESLNGSLTNLLLIDNVYLVLGEGIFDSIGASLTKLVIVKSRASSQGIYAPLTSVTYLHLDRFSTNGSLGETFSRLRNLKKLKLQSFINNLTKETFQHVARCESLVLEEAGIQHIHPLAFAGLRNLTILDLSYNFHMNISDVLPSLRNISPTIKILKLQCLTGLSRPTTFLEDDFFEVVAKMKNLEKLYLNKNEILHIFWTIRNTPMSLKVLDLSYNRLCNVFYLVSELFLLDNLVNMTIKYQSKRYSGYGREDDDKDGVTGREFYGYDDDDDWTNGQTRKIPRSRIDQRTSDRDHSGLGAKGSIACKFPRNPKAGDMDAMNWCLPCPRNLKNLILDGVMNIYMRDMPSILVLGNCSIEKISLRQNGFSCADGPLMIDRPLAAKPVSIDLSSNQMEYLSPDLFKFSISRNFTIGEFNLESNILSNQLTHDIEGKVFSRYVNLTILNLSDNKLKKMPKNIFRNLSNLVILNLSRNSLQILEFDVRHMTQLSILDIAENLFVSLDVYQQIIFSYMSVQRGYWNFGIYLESNPMQCSCETMGFIRWILSNNTKIYDFSALNCLYYSEIKSLNETDSIATMLNLFCYASLPLTVVGTLLGLAMFCFLVGYVFYKYRWDVRYYLLRKSRERNLSVKTRNSNHYYYYDAFVCYDKRDITWVLQELVENLENPEKFNDSEASVRSSCSSSHEGAPGESGRPRSERESRRVEPESTNGDLRLCIHVRDFIPGEEIEWNILKALENSRRVILVISKSFLESKWCCLELEIAKMESLVRGGNLIIAIFLEPLEDTTRSLEWLTKYYTYLEWFRYDGYRRHEFWRRLRVSIGTRSRRKELNHLSTERWS